jgi:thiamine biosynthesis protein ThiI
MEFKEDERLVLVHFGELWLRGRNRNSYIKRLAKNINDSMQGEDIYLDRLYDRFVLRLGKDSDIDRVKDKLRHTFGISNYEVAYTTKSDMKSIVKLATKLLAGMEKSTLKISAHRTYKDLPFNSVDIVDKLFQIAKKMKFPLSNKGFDNELKVNVTKDVTFISYDKTRAFGGLPVGTSGKGVVLLSGGIDSPVAAWYAMKRGVELTFIHIHGYPDNKEVLASKMPKIFEELAKYSPRPKIYYIPSHIFQLSAMKAGRYELILLKSFMFMVAEKVAEREGANMIFSGESLGQVASQTPSNIAAESDGIEIPILRPLIGFDKQEIIKIAREIGTYDLSIIPYKDVCSINSKNPKTQTSIEKIREIKKSTKLSTIVSRTLKAAQVGEDI